MKQHTEISYWSNGRKSSETPRLNGVIHGLFKDWYRSGNISTETSYLNGKWCGIRRYWHSDKKLISNTTFKQNMKHGIELRFN